MRYLLIIALLFSTATAQNTFFGVLAGSGQKYDSLVRKWSIATGITNATVLNKLNTFVRGLRDSSLIGNMVSIHPYMGGTSTSVVFNLIDTATYKLQLVGSPTVNDTGIVLNGSSQYARTANTEYYLSEILGTSNYTFISRVKLTALPNATNGAGTIAVSISTDGNAALFENTLVNNTSDYRTSHRNFTTSAGFLFPATTYNLNTWYNIGATYDGSNLRNYQNATLSATTARTGNLSTSVLDNAYRFVGHGVRPASLRGSTNSFLTGTFAFALVSKGTLTASQMSYINTLIDNLKN